MLDEEKRRAEEEMLLALKAKPKTDIASNSNSQYNKSTKKSPTISEMRSVGENHYHVMNPNSTSKHDYYLDKYGNPAPKNSKQSHIIP